MVPEKQTKSELVLEADELREDHPGCGVEKMYHTLKPDFIGRDRFVELMMELGYRLKRKKNYRRTTIASKIYYPNLIKGMAVDRPSMVWQSDITYIPIGGRHYYAERINRTIKEEYLDHWRPKDFGQLKRMTAKAVKNYNSKRLHNNNNRMSPEKFIGQFPLLRPQQRKLMTIFDNQLVN